jgi:hypothetical protein
MPLTDPSAATAPRGMATAVSGSPPIVILAGLSRNHRPIEQAGHFRAVCTLGPRRPIRGRIGQHSTHGRPGDGLEDADAISGSHEERKARARRRRQCERHIDAANKARCGNVTRYCIYMHIHAYTGERYGAERVHIYMRTQYICRRGCIYTGMRYGAGRVHVLTRPQSSPVGCRPSAYGREPTALTHNDSRR